MPLRNSASRTEMIATISPYPAPITCRRVIYFFPSGLAVPGRHWRTWFCRSLSPSEPGHSISQASANGGCVVFAGMHSVTLPRAFEYMESLRAVSVRKSLEVRESQKMVPICVGDAFFTISSKSGKDHFRKLPERRNGFAPCSPRLYRGTTRTMKR